jgi:hypothetical protein
MFEREGVVRLCVDYRIRCCVVNLNCRLRVSYLTMILSLSLATSHKRWYGNPPQLYMRKKEASGWFGFGRHKERCRISLIRVSRQEFQSVPVLSGGSSNISTNDYSCNCIL